ncbi:MAG: peptidylprolyl isomerase [Leptolyngbyaceae cyanobacterium SL_7_1]|nr:peptidylprolyl isomerase [Leptolyngbyaceae cyanobacterium SL_7_1]
MTTKPFITVDTDSIGLGQAFRYLQTAGKLDEVVSVILQRYFLERELAQAEETIAPEQIEQAIIQFRLNNHLTDPDMFQQWLTREALDAFGFRQQVLQQLRLLHLKQRVTQPKLAEYFIERKLSLDQVVLSRISVVEREVADELKCQLNEGAEFEALAKEHSLTDDRLFNGMMGLVSRASLPDTLRAAVDLAAIGDIIGPLNLDNGWMLFRLEKVLPASLENPQLHQTLQDELFQQWLMESCTKAKIEVNVEA